MLPGTLPVSFLTPHWLNQRHFHLRAVVALYQRVLMRPFSFTLRGNMLAQAMGWPDAFALVGGAFATAFIIYAVCKYA